MAKLARQCSVPTAAGTVEIGLESTSPACLDHDSLNSWLSLGTKITAEQPDAPTQHRGLRRMRDKVPAMPCCCPSLGMRVTVVAHTIEPLGSLPR